MASKKTPKTRPSAREGSGLTLVDAPWRHHLFDKPGDSDCFICRAWREDPKNDSRNLLLVRGKDALIILNRYPYTMGALMVAPIEHRADITLIPEETLLEIMQMVKTGIRVLDHAIRPKGYNIGINQGADAGAGLHEHLHVHVVPRWRADTNFMSTIGNARVLAEDVDSMYKKLKRSIKQLQ
ncbi:MAG: HIT domain-containing protein [Anaerolineae bacterium]